LASLYLEAFNHTGNQLYKKIAVEVLSFVEKEWWQEEGFFFSAFDADSDGEEGKYYVWTVEDLKDLLDKDYDFFNKYYQINENSYWEHSNYILMRQEDLSALLSEYNLSMQEADAKIELCKERLKQEVLSRIKPGLDDKMITSWNAMMCAAFAQACLTLDKERYLNITLKSAIFLRDKMVDKRGELRRTYKQGKARIAAFLEDYALVADAWMQLYLVTGDESWLEQARTLTQKALDLFQNPNSVMLYYTAVNAAELVTRTSEIADNVTPASNSQMALNLHRLGMYYGLTEWRERAKRMLSLVSDDFKSYGSAYSNWACLALYLNYPARELAVVGKNVNEIVSRLYRHTLTNTIFAWSSSSSALPLLKERYKDGETLIYVCENNVCGLPVNTVEEAIQLLE
jgi:uncharacterized protein YyaL (SSP411 family)